MLTVTGLTPAFLSMILASHAERVLLAGGGGDSSPIPFDDWVSLQLGPIHAGGFSESIEKWETECRQRIARLDELRLFDSGVHGRLLFEG